MWNASQNASLTAIVLTILHAATTNVMIHASTLVDAMPNATFVTTVLSVPAFPVTLEILSLSVSSLLQLILLCPTLAILHLVVSMPSPDLVEIDASVPALQDFKEIPSRSANQSALSIPIVQELLHVSVRNVKILASMTTSAVSMRYVKPTITEPTAFAHLVTKAMPSRFADLLENVSNIYFAKLHLF